MPERALARFRREAETASRIDHEGVCKIYEVGEDRGVYFIAMQLVRGETLEDRIHRLREDDAPRSTSAEQTRIADSIRLIEKAARALDAAHRVAGTGGRLRPIYLRLGPHET